MDKVSMNVPLVDLKSQCLSIQQEIDGAINRVLHSGNYVMGQEVEAFEREWADYCKAKYCVGVSSCTDALYLALKALKVVGEQVITTPATFFATTQAIIASGNFPAFVDVDETGNLPPLNFGDHVAIPVHLYGRPGMWKGSKIIEDSAHAHGLPLSGLVACYSFYPTKNLGAIGQAGAVVTNDKGLADTIRGMRVYCERERFVHYGLTGNFRMDELQAAILRAKLPHVDEWNASRRTLAILYRLRLGCVNDIVQLPQDHPGHVYHMFTIRCRNRDSLAEYLKWCGIQTAVRYPVPMHLQPVLKYLGYRKGDFPVAEKWAETNLSLPMYPELKVYQIEYICDKIKEWVGKKCASAQ